MKLDVCIIDANVSQMPIAQLYHYQIDYSYRKSGMQFHSNPLGKP